MKRFLKILGGIAIGLIVLIALAIAGVFTLLPKKRPPVSEAVERTPARIERGRYLVENVSDCVGCHSERLVDRYTMPIRPGAEGAGGLDFSENGMRLFTPNITPDKETGLGNWTDGEIMRAVREGVARDGRPLFPIMPYELFSKMSDDDIRAVVAYLRTMPPRKHTVPPREIPFPLTAIMRTIPKPLSQPVPSIDRTKDPIAYGKYLTTIGGCIFCHSPKDDHMQNLPGQEYSGGYEMKIPGNGRVITPNLTPDPATFIGGSTREEFITHMQAMKTLTAENAPVAPPGRNTVMPWTAYAGMTREDLGCIYDFLHSLKPVHRVVNPFPDAK